MLKAIVAMVVVASIVSITPISAQEPTPTPTPIPTSKITIRFVRDGQPVTINAGASLYRVMADAIACPIMELPAAGPMEGYIIFWPFRAAEFGGLPGPPECSKGPPTTLRLEAATEFGLLFAEFVWTGGDMTVDIEVPGAPTPTPTALAQVLPNTGARPGDSAPVANGLLIVLITASSLILVPLATLLYLRR